MTVTVIYWSTSSRDHVCLALALALARLLVSIEQVPTVAADRLAANIRPKVAGRISLGE